MSLKFQITSVLPSLTLYDNILLALQAQVLAGRLWSSRAAATRCMIGHGHAGPSSVWQTAPAMPASALSHGQQQWLEIAMALAAEAEIVAAGRADRRHEPGGAAGHRRIAAADQDQHCSLVIVEHDLDFIRDICDRLTVLDQGSVLVSGPVPEIQAKHRVQEVYLRRA